MPLKNRFWPPGPQFETIWYLLDPGKYHFYISYARKLSIKSGPVIKSSDRFQCILSIFCGFLFEKCLNDVILLHRLA